MKSTVYAALITAAYILALIGSLTWDAAILVVALVAVKAVEIETKERDETSNRAVMASLYLCLVAGIAPPPPIWFSVKFDYPGAPEYDSPDYPKWAEKREEALEWSWRLEYAKRIFKGVADATDD